MTDALQGDFLTRIRGGDGLPTRSSINWEAIGVVLIAISMLGALGLWVIDIQIKEAVRAPIELLQQQQRQMDERIKSLENDRLDQQRQK